MPEQLIPIQDGTHVIARMPLEWLTEHQHYYRLKYNKRGNLQRAFVRDRRELSPLSNRGVSFEQRLSTGVVWALRGVRGS